MKLKNVHQRHGRWYYIRSLEKRSPKTGRPLQRWEPLTRVADGEAALLKAMAGLLGEPVDRAGNMERLLDAFKGERLRHLGSAVVRKEYERMYAVIAKAFKQFDANQVTPGVVLEFIDQFSATPNTRRKYKARLSTFFSWCVLNAHLQVNPCREIRVKAPPRQRGGLNAEIYWRLHDALTPMGKCFLELSFLTCQRPTEIRELRESRIDPAYAKGYIHFVPSKTEASSGEEVFTKITPEIRACLARARALRPERKVAFLERARDPFIIQTRDGDGYSKNGLYEVWRAAVNQAGCKGITTRHIRPFALWKMKEAGHDMPAIQLSAAHSSITTTEGYLNQHRPRLSDVRLALPERIK
jgi:integrase